MMQHDVALIWTLDENPSDEAGPLRESLRRYNMAASSIADQVELVLSVRDRQGRLLAGAAGRLWGQALHIGMLWVDDSLRGRGIGSQLLARLETEAARRGGRTAFLDTFTFQAPAFYPRRGYETFGVIEIIPGQVEKFFMRKQIADRQEES